MEIFFILAFIAPLFIIFWIIETISNSKKYILLKPRLDILDEDEKRIIVENEKLSKRELLIKQTAESVKLKLHKIAKQKSMGFYLFSDYFRAN